MRKLFLSTFCLFVAFAGISSAEELEKKSDLMIKLGQIDKGAAIESKEAKELKEKEKAAKEAEPEA